MVRVNFINLFAPYAYLLHSKDVRLETDGEDDNGIDWESVGLRNVYIQMVLMPIPHSLRLIIPQ